MTNNWGKERVRADIESFKAALIGAEIEEVDEPTGRKQVEIAWEDEDGFHTESGESYGVYRDNDVYHVDWTDDRDRTTVTSDQLVTLEESDWYSGDETPK